MAGEDRQVALVTGASSGVGVEVARRFARGGYDVALGARRVERLEALSMSIAEDTGVQTLAHSLDLRNPESIKTFADQTIDRFGHVDAFINCAGLALGREPAHKADTGEWMNMIETDYVGPIRLARELLPLMTERGSGHILNIGALAALYPHPGSAVYASSKEAIRMFLQCLREDTLGSGVRVTNIDPGIIRTEFAKTRFRGDEEAVSKLMSGFRPLEPDDVAQCVWFAASMPAHVNIDQITVLPTDQTSPTRIHKTK